MSRPRGTGRIYNQKQSSILWIQYYRNGKMHRESTDEHQQRTRRATLFEPAMVAAIDLDQFAVALAPETGLMKAPVLLARQPQSILHLRRVSRETLTPSFVSRTSAARLGPKSA